MIKKIVIKGAKEHNLKNISLEIPKDKFIVITGLSGSGKSSLAFDTIYAEGQRRYVESLSAYARQFLDKMKKPNVDLIEGLSPAISIEQKNTSKNPRSTVATVTEIYDYMRVLYARAGIPMMPVVKGIEYTKIQIVLYSILLMVVSLLLFATGYFGYLYLIGASILGGIFIQKSWKLKKSTGANNSMSLFLYSIVYLTLIFILMIVDRAVTTYV